MEPILRQKSVYSCSVPWTIFFIAHPTIGSAPVRKTSRCRFS